MNRSLSNTISHSEDWWSQPQVLLDFSHNYQRRTLGLFISGMLDGQYYNKLFSGFAFEYNGHILWLTAGHIIDDLNYARQNYRENIAIMTWFNYFGEEVPEAGAFPTHHRDFKCFSGTSNGFDIGFGVLTGLDELNIRLNPHIELATGTIDDTPQLIAAQGYHLIGYPGELESFTQEPVNTRQIRNNFVGKLACLPLEHADWIESGLPATFWDDPEAFYGHLLDLPPSWDIPPDSIVGMSGGPIYAIAQQPNGQVSVQLAAIQSKWIRSSRIIRAEPMSRVLEFIDHSLARYVGS